MSSLQYSERNLLEKILEMRTGRVSDFSDRTLREFVLENTEIDVFTEPYEENGTSKANRVRTFWKKESDELTADLIEALLDHAYREKTDYDRELHARDEHLFIEARKIITRLRDSSESTSETQHSSFVKIAPGANVEGLEMIDNTMIGKGKFLDVQGKLIDAKLSGNKHSLHSDPRSLKSGISFHNSNVHFGHGGITSTNNKTNPNKFRWLELIGVAIAALALIWAIYTYLVPNSSFGIVKTYIGLSDTSTTTPNLAAIFKKSNSYVTSLEREEFMEKYSGQAVHGSGAFEDISKSGTGYLVRMVISNNAVACAFSIDSEKQLLLIQKGENIDFYGVFSGGGVFWGGGVNPWYIENCAFSK